MCFSKDISAKLMLRRIEICKQRSAVKSVPEDLVWKCRGQHTVVLFARSIQLADVCLKVFICDFFLFILVSCIRLAGS